MLNRLFYGSIGFHNGVRISATLNALVFMVANGLMRTRLPPKKVAGNYLPVVMGFLRDIPYLLVLIA
jgi:MCP family monocarboxylic acid transporter-like MFS transporter 10